MSVNAMVPGTDEARLRLVFVAGWGRSGSTILGSSLCAGGAAANLGETRYLYARGLPDGRCGCGESVPECPVWSAAIGDSSEFSPAELDRLVGAGASWRQLRSLLGWTRRPRGRLARAGEEHARTLLSAARSQHADVIVETSKSAMYLLPLLHTDRFDVRVVHLVRDPIESASAWAQRKETGERPGEIMKQFGALRSAAYWCVLNTLPLLVAARFRLPYLRISYDQWVRDPYGVTGRIADTVGIDFVPSAWPSPTRVELNVEHTISGNPSRFQHGVVDLDRRVAARPPAALDRAIVTTLCGPLWWILRRPVTWDRGRGPAPAR